MKYLFFLLLYAISLQSNLCPSLILETQPQKIAAIDKAIIELYAKELLGANLCTDKETALKVSQKECAIKDPDETRIYYQIVLEDGIDCGYLVYAFKSGETFLDALFIKEEFQGKGIGKQALLNLEKEAKKNGITKIDLHVFDHNKPAYNLYKKMGYKIKTTYFKEDKPISYHMEKKLDL